MSWGNTETWKIVYIPTPDKMNNGYRGVALVEAANRQDAMYNFMQEYSGQFHTIEKCEKLLG